MKKCPKCDGTQFIVTRHVAQTVMLDENGNFVKEISSCDEITHDADDDDIWMCNKCGYEAVGSKFNIAPKSSGGIRSPKKKFIKLGIYDQGEIVIPQRPEEVFLQDVVSTFVLVEKLPSNCYLGEGMMGLKGYKLDGAKYELAHITKLSTWQAIVENGFANCLENRKYDEDNSLRFVLKSNHPIDTAVFDLLYETYPNTKLEDILWYCERLEAVKWAEAHGADKHYKGLTDPMQTIMAYSRKRDHEEIFEYLYGCKQADYLAELKSRKEK